MAYTKTTWVDGETPANATNMNHIEDGIEANDNAKQQDITTGGDPVKCGYKVDGKDVYVKRIDLGALPNSTTKNVAHGLSNFTIIDYKGVATKGVTQIILPYLAGPNASNNQYIIGIDVNSTNIVILTGADRSLFTGVLNIYFTYNS